MVAAVERVIRPGRIEKPMVGLGRKIATDASNLFYSWGFFLPGQDFWEPEDAAVIENIGRDQTRLESIAFRVIITSARRKVSLDSAEGRFLGACTFYQEVSELFNTAEKGQERNALENTMQKMQIVIGQFGLYQLNLKNGRAFSPDLINGLHKTQAADFPFTNLSEIETTMLHLLALGKTDKQIAQLLGFAPHTVRNRFTSIYDKLKVDGRIRAILKLVGHGTEQQPK